MLGKPVVTVATVGGVGSFASPAAAAAAAAAAADPAIDAATRGPVMRLATRKQSYFIPDTSVAVKSLEVATLQRRRRTVSHSEKSPPLLLLLLLLLLPCQWDHIM